VVLDKSSTSSARHSASGNDEDRILLDEDISCSRILSHALILDKRFTLSNVEMTWMSLVRTSSKLSQSECYKLNVNSAA